MVRYAISFTKLKEMKRAEFSTAMIASRTHDAAKHSAVIHVQICWSVHFQHISHPLIVAPANPYTQPHGWIENQMQSSVFSAVHSSVWLVFEKSAR